jgi:hypothetical protein
MHTSFSARRQRLEAGQCRPHLFDSSSGLVENPQPPFQLLIDADGITLIVPSFSMLFEI